MSSRKSKPPSAEKKRRNEGTVSSSVSSQGDGDVGSWENISASQLTNKVESLSDANSEAQTLSPETSERVPLQEADSRRSSNAEEPSEKLGQLDDDGTEGMPEGEQQRDEDDKGNAEATVGSKELSDAERSKGEVSDADSSSDSSNSEDESEDKALHSKVDARNVSENRDEDEASEEESDEAPEEQTKVASASSSSSSSEEEGDESSEEEDENTKKAETIATSKVKPRTSSSSSSSSSSESDQNEHDDLVNENTLTSKARAQSESSSSSSSDDESEEEDIKETMKQKSSSTKTQSNSSSSEDEEEDEQSGSDKDEEIDEGSEEEEESEEEESEEEEEEESEEEESDGEALPPPPPVKKIVHRNREPGQTQAMEPSVHKRAVKRSTSRVDSKHERSSSSSSSEENSSSSSGSHDIEAGRVHRRRHSNSSDEDDSDSDDDGDSEEGSGSSDSDDSEMSSGSVSKNRSFRMRLRTAVSKFWRSSKRFYLTGIKPRVAKCNKVIASSRFGPQFARFKAHVSNAASVLRDDWGEVRRLRRSLVSKPRSDWNLKQLPSRTKLAVGRVLFVAITAIVLLLILFSSGGKGLSFLRAGTKRSKVPDFPNNWKRTRELSFNELMDLIHVYDNSLRNDSSIKIKKMPTLDKPIYLTMSSKDLIQIKRPAVRKKRPDEPRAVRTFGCLRDGCRGLEIEDLLDRGWQMRFRAAQKNDTYKNINYRVTFLLTDTTQLNHMRAVRKDLYEAIYHTYEGKSYLIAFDGADAIGGNKGQQLKVKERFVRKYGCKFTELAVTPASYRLYLEDECQDLISFGSSDATWLLKPETGSQGQGITFHTEVADIMQKQPKFFPCAQREWKATERFLVQEYIEHPLLLKKCKFDARVYMNVASSYPWLVFYHEGYLRRALATYAPLSRDRRVYLTNTHFQSMKKDFKLSEHIWSFQEFQAYLKEQGRTGAQYVSSILNPYVKKVAHFIFQSARAKLIKRKGTFHIMGLDFMIDEDFHVWFIEANGFPGFTWSINFDTRTMVEEWFNLAQQVHENPRFYMLMREGDRYGGFEMIFSEMEEERLQTLYNPCQEFKYNRGYTAPLKEANRLFAQISGKGGKTERFKRFTNTIAGAHLIGGTRHEQLQARENYFKKFGCRLNSVRLTLPTYALYEPEQCNNFFTEYSTSNAAWVVKPVISPGNGEELRVFANLAAMKDEFGECTQRSPDYVVQQLAPEPPLIRYKWWDIRVYMLIAHTKPWMVFYHHGFARTSKLSYVPGGEAQNPEGAATTSEKEKDDEEDSVEMEEEDSGDDDDGKGSDKAGGDKGEKEKDEGNDIPAMANMPQMDNTNQNPLEPQPPAEPWAPPKITTGATFSLGEEFMSLEQMEDEMARAELAGSRWLSSVFDTYAKRIAHYLFQSARHELHRGNETYQITSLNFLVDNKMQIHFVGARNVDADSIPNVDALQEHKANFLETLAGLVLELNTMPGAFARMRRGDSYGQWRLVFSEMEEHQRSMQHYDPCDEFKRNLQVSKSSLYKDAWLHQHVLKSHARNKRELRKYIDRKWESACKNKPTAELRASCIRNTISYRYKKYIEKERVPYQEGYVENYIRELEHRPKTQGSGGQGGGL